MIQELFGGGATNFISGERKISINGGGPVLLPPTLPSSLPSSSSSTHTSTATAAAAPTSSENQQNLRCPRCDSSNTKFCYYNNYNLTQPRHFCKTCRRYWTKGGALRNIPIGGGCRKNRNVNGVSNSATAKTSSSATASKMKAVASELGRTSGLGPSEPSSGPILWGSPQNTHLLALLRASNNQNPNPNPSSMSLNPVTTVKDEGNLMGSSQPYMVTHEPLNHRALGFDGSVGGQVVPSMGLCTSMWRNTTQDQHHQNSGYVLGQHHQGSGIQELYHKFRSSSGNYCGDNIPPMFLGNMASSSSSSLSSILESSSVAGGGSTELGCWNIPTLPWSTDLPTTNGAYP